MTGDSGERRVVLVGGGARSGKSAHALELALSLGRRRTFLATAQAGDSEMHDRIDRHREERGDQFHTIEVPLDLPEALSDLDACDVAVVDCLTLWVSNLMGRAHDDQVSDPAEVVDRRIDDLVIALKQCSCHVIVVSNEVGMGIVPMHASARAFRDHIGRAHARIAEVADEVILAILGCLVRLKPDMQIPTGFGDRQEEA